MRVVAAKQPTYVEWITADGQTKGSAVLNRGKFQQIEVLTSTQPLRVKCNDSCSVTQYNKGKVCDIFLIRPRTVVFEADFCFTADFLVFFSKRDLRGSLVERREILHDDQTVGRIV